MPKIYQTPGVRDFQVPGRPPDVFNHPDGTAEFSCARSLHVGGIDWNPRLILLDGRLVAYQFTVERAYDDLRAIALQRFGPPASVKTEQYRTGPRMAVAGRDVGNPQRTLLKDLDNIFAGWNQSLFRTSREETPGAVGKVEKVFLVAARYCSLM